MTIAVRFDNVSKKFKSNFALQDFTLAIPERSVFGLVGRNGAGKTTAIRILLGLARTTTGTVTLFDGDTQRRVGFLPDVPAQYGWMTAYEYLSLIAGIANVPQDLREQRIRSLLAVSGLEGTSHRIGGYSRGMRQRLGIAQAMTGAPDLLVLDEPTSALDPLGRRDVLNLIAELRGHTTILFSTHILSDVERVADQIGVIEQSRLIASGTIDHVRSQAGMSPRIDVKIGEGVERVVSRLREEPWVGSINVDGQNVRIQTSDCHTAWRRIPVIVAGSDASLMRLEWIEPTLEDVFVKLTESAS